MSFEIRKDHHPDLKQFWDKLSELSKKPQKICTVINYCTNDYRFIYDCVSQASQFSEEVIVPYTDHFYDGSTENLELLERTKIENPEARFVFFPYNPELKVNAQYWVTLARKTGFLESRPDIDFILFLDADEIVDAGRFLQWLKKYSFTKFNIQKLANYYYFREASYQAITFEDSAILVRRNLLNEEMIMDFEDRNMPFKRISDPKERMVLGLDGKPMIHHYSWVRTKDEMLKKVLTWGHNEDRNWVELVEKEFESEFSGTDFVHGYHYQTVESFIKSF